MEPKTIQINKFGCMYLAADEPESLINWYNKHFNSFNTRKYTLFWGPKKENVVTINFITDEYIPRQAL
ncbi:hypothetical protein FHS15_004866 [Paenibacillus castaneae]|uniref:hypothetical protein n=1 Tax=Paenibacillus castaneae TaxID=474957 RepID=UPI000C9AA258|nr:hypothetical protein [Paenibacillus castaneae]NIK79699.1 hypothetical protein [Paenibacillus castaneae]